MKLLSVIFLVIISYSYIYSQDEIKVTPKFDDSVIDDNYLEGVKSSNLGLKVSATYYLGERKSTKALIPLMNILRNDKDPEARIMAALSLFKIGNARGIYAIKGAMTEDDSEWVKNMCKIFYQMSLQNKEYEQID